MDPVTAIVGGGSIISGVGGMFASDEAADAQVEAAGAANATQLKMFETAREDLQPYREGGTLSLDQQLDLMGLNGLTKQKNALKLFQTSPGYTFRVGEGTKAIQRSAAAKGNLLSPATMKELTTYTQGLAGEEYGNYYNRLNALTSLGENAAAMSGNQAIQTGQQVGQNLLSAGNAQASGYINQANALTGTSNSLSNNLLMWKLINK